MPPTRSSDGWRAPAWRGPLTVLLLLAAAALLFQFLQRRISGAWIAFASHPEVMSALDRSLDDQKRLAELDPDGETAYRSRFAELETLNQRLRILRHNRDEIVRRYEQLLLVAFLAAALLAATVVVLRQRRDERRLARLGEALAGLAEGRIDLGLGEPRRDIIGRIAGMVERTSRRMARDRQRLEALKNLSAWQEAARRHAHEMRTPLTGARLEIERIEPLLGTAPDGQRDEVRRATESALQELERLGKFTQRFASFARLPAPRTERHDLAALVEEFVATFASAWDNLELRFAGAPRCDIEIDREMLRQVLVNLCDNSSLSLAEHPPEGRTQGTVTFEIAAGAFGPSLVVADDGPGVAPEMRHRLFDPYASTRTLGEGLGLGLAISKKILLDHGGDLELVPSQHGATFRLNFPQPQETSAP